MSEAALFLICLCSGIGLYAYGGYPAALWLLSRVRGKRPLSPDDPASWPMVSISLPAYNEADVLEDTLESLLALDYPKHRLQIVIVSDASTDGTNEIVQSYAEHGVELIPLQERHGKTAAENEAASHLRGEIVVNTDASTRIPPHSLKPLIRAFQDPSVGVASGRDLSVAKEGADTVKGESGYVGYEMWLRDLETQVHSIVGASGCFYAIRRELHEDPVPGELSRDFMAALRAREAGFRAVSVSEAVALVPRARSLGSEASRKVRTMLRGLSTLWYKRHLLNPFRWGSFAWMLFSHKLARWLVPLTFPGALLGLGLLSWMGNAAASAVLGISGVGAALGLLALRWPDEKDLPGVLATCGYLTVGMGAGLVAWSKAVVRERKPVWEPTRR